MRDINAMDMIINAMGIIEWRPSVFWTFYAMEK